MWSELNKWQTIKHSTSDWPYQQQHNSRVFSKQNATALLLLLRCISVQNYSLAEKGREDERKRTCYVVKVGEMNNNAFPIFKFFWLAQTVCSQYTLNWLKYRSNDYTIDFSLCSFSTSNQFNAKKKGDALNANTMTNSYTICFVFGWTFYYSSDALECLYIFYNPNFPDRDEVRLYFDTIRCELTNAVDDSITLTRYNQSKSSVVNELLVTFFAHRIWTYATTKRMKSLSDQFFLHLFKMCSDTYKT